MKNIVQSLLLIFCFVLSSQSIAKDQWHIGVGVGMSNFPLPGNGQPYTSGTINFDALESSDAIPTLDIYFVKESSSWTFLLGIVPSVEESFNYNVTPAPTVSDAATFSMIEFGFLYDVFHSKNGWFIDAGIRSGTPLSGDLEYTFYDQAGTSYTYKSGVARGYIRTEIGVGKTIGNWVVRFAFGGQDANNSATLTGTDGTDFSVYSNEGRATSSITVSYWW